MIHKKLLGSFFNAVIFNALIKITSIYKISFIVGSHLAFFSLAMVTVPLSGAFTGILGSVLTFCLRVLISLFFTHSFSLHLLAFYIPGLFGSLYWAISSKYLKVLPSLICIILFLIHPIGCQAAVYSLFWLFPIAANFYWKETLFVHALGSTFTMHAVGSIIWLYTIGLSPDAWLMLIPVVIVERLLFASSMVIVHRIIEWTLLLDATRFSFASIKVN